MENSIKPGTKKIVISMGLAVALIAGVTACTEENSDKGTVVSITDGDTLVAAVNGQEQTIRLLNIDTPETKDPNKPVECLGEEATAFLTALLPVGSEVKLMYDQERTDKYQRTLAAVFTSDNKLVSAEIARAGLGTAKVVGKNATFISPVEDAQREAQEASRGIYDPSEECTIPAQIVTTTQALESATLAVAETTSAGTGAVLATAAASIAAAQALHALLKAGPSGSDTVRWAAFSADELSTIAGDLAVKINMAENNITQLKAKETSLKASEDAAIRVAADKAQKQAEEAARALATERAAAEKQAQAEAAAAAEVERIRNLQPVYQPPAPPAAPAYEPPPAYQPPPQNSGGSKDGYTGPRCYLPGGKTYRPC